MISRRIATVLAVVVGVKSMAESGALIPVWASWRYEVLTVGRMPARGWETPGFDDRSWSVGPAGFSAGMYGYDQAATLLPTYDQGTTVRGVLMRHAWEVRDPGAIETLTLRIDYEDGVVGWLNGEEVFRRGLPEGVPFTGQEVPVARFSGAVDLVDLTPFRNRLVSGTNVLALAVLEASGFGASLFVWPELRANFTRGPLVQRVSSDAAVVYWRTAAPVDARLVYRDSGSEGPEIRVGAGLGTNGAVELSGLKEGTTYEYRVEWDGTAGPVRSEPARFTTLRTSGDLDFLVVGDTGSGSAAQHAVAAAMAREKTDLVLHTGDISYPVFTDGEIDLRCHGAYEPQMRGVPFFFTVGNHDFYRGDAAYLDAFWLPTNSTTRTEHYYSFDHGDAHFVSLFVPWFGVSQFGTISEDGARSGPYRWLTNDLATTTKPWKFVFFHQPIRTSGPHILDDYDANGRQDVLESRESLMPALAAGGVQMVFMGHDHTWERFAPLDGVHALVTGGGGAFLYPQYRRDPGSAQYGSRHHFSRVSIRGTEMRLEAVGIDGGVLDRFTVRRRGGGGGDAPRLASRWVTASPGASGPRNDDGNVPGERFDLEGDGWATIPGATANPGRLVVNHDGLRVRIGLRDAMLWPGQTLALFVGNPEVPGAPRCDGVGAGRGHPLSRLSLDFRGFAPGWLALLGDEFADETNPDFRRAGDPVALGQGVFRLDADLNPIGGSPVRQFNRSPEVSPVYGEENADFMIVDLPREVLGAARVGAELRLGAVVVTPVSDAGGVRLEADTAYVGGGLSRDAAGRWVLEPGVVELGEVPGVDRDGDGLAEAREAELGTDANHPDTDRDGLPDGWEVEHGLDPKSATGVDGAEGDADGDGYGNREEFDSGMSPRLAADPLRVRAMRQGTTLRLDWRAVVGRRYEIETASRLPGPFGPVPVAGFPRRAGGTNETALIPGAGAGGATWYRVSEMR
ncbi:MAG: metallophosphoesterase family protein [Verrucomicrobiales bacterium]|nr:metallophosphoesterase family protein [Verrucomicrobiales bacterium]